MQREDELLSTWWKECAESSAGPIETSFVSKSPLHINRTLAGTPQSGQLYSTDEERVGVPVKGGLYEVLLYAIVLSIHIVVFCIVIFGILTICSSPFKRGGYFIKGELIAFSYVAHHHS